ncbi:hypothetical protein [[Kitasatospora] papulosa]|uniref:hypothetical protein n=1 Tax=[Kitasatospora] papulosa TaxID=1464011 RepID=UPI0036E4F5DF
MLTVGMTLVCVGLWADHAGQWDGHEFLTNLVSSVTSLCFGVPAALLVFSHLGSTQEEAKVTARSRAHATQEIAEYEAALLEPFTVGDVAELNSKVQWLRRKLSIVRLQRAGDEDESEDAVRDFFQDLRDLLALSGRRPLDAFGALPRAGLWPEMSKWQMRVTSQWRILDEEVRPRVSEAGLPWLAHSPSSEVRQAAKWLLLEGRNPWKELPRTDARGRSAERAMAYFLDDLAALCTAAEQLTARYPS